MGALQRVSSVVGSPILPAGHGPSRLCSCLPDTGKWLAWDSPPLCGWPRALILSSAPAVCLKCDAQERLLSPALLPAACCEDCREPFWMAASRGPATPRLRVIRYLAGKGQGLWGQEAKDPGVQLGERHVPGLEAKP